MGWKCGWSGLAARLWILTWFARWSPITGRSNVCYSSTTLRQPAVCRSPFSPIKPHFDTDYYPIKIDDYCTVSITIDLKDIVGKPVLIVSQIGGFTGVQTLVTF